MTLDDFKKAREAYNRIKALDDVLKVLEITEDRMNSGQNIEGKEFITITNDAFNSAKIDVLTCESFFEELKTLCVKHKLLAEDELEEM